MKKSFAALALFMFLAGCSNESSSDKSVSENKESNTETGDITAENKSESSTSNQEGQNIDEKENSNISETDSQALEESQKESSGNTEDKEAGTETDKNMGKKDKYIENLNDIEQAAAEIRNTDDDTTIGMTKSEEEILKKWDQALNEIYQVLEKQLPKSEMEKLRGEQRKWIAYRDETAKEAAKKYEGGTLESLEYIASQAGTTKDRCYELVEGYMK
ncbi:lysozyme inhibitor LprI family protein [Cytobacillus pseudoceanisediminis]|uniref:Lysozyme inhibitor LprI-like N-terminal domain-containing protein n=2 Tax=Cytobacillus TaxID=2675230 RepID=A0ABX3CX83_9BACI|nr:lysozyme inhibitor LprI family protein [Cytobacillus oceanisediminis]OHX49923.1 hypothetical protein BBV17_10505 [Cytobacillus oceanisediminis]QOK25877.1 DUF1311 domain-containing protein [Cytobacillus oceanisediminis]